MFNKRGDTITDHLVLWIPKFIYLIIAFLAVIFLIRILIITNIDTTEAEAKILINRILFSPNTILYFNKDTNRAYPGIIDFEKFRKLQNLDLNELDTKIITYGVDNKLIAAKLTLENIETGAEETAFYNKANYEFWEPRILSTVTGGTGSVNFVSEKRYVLIKMGEKFNKGTLKIDVIVRR